MGRLQNTDVLETNVADDLYPNNGEYFTPTEPKEQSIERKKERAKTLEALPILKELVERMDERVADRDKLSAIQVDLKEDPALYQKVAEVNHMLNVALQEDRAWIQDFIDTHTGK